MIPFICGTYHGLFVQTEFPSVFPGDISYFDFRVRGARCIPADQNPNLVIRFNISAGSPMIMVSLVYEAVEGTRKGFVGFGCLIFEKDFNDINEVPINAYDHTINSSFWFRFIRRSFINFFTFRCGVKKILSDLSLCIDYKRFFQNGRVHFKRKIGLKSKNETSLTDCLIEDNMNAPFFLKIDIEGSEYRILEQLLESSNLINGLAIEVPSR